MCRMRGALDLGIFYTSGECGELDYGIFYTSGECEELDLGIKCELNHGIHRKLSYVHQDQG